MPMTFAALAFGAMLALANASPTPSWTGNSTSTTSHRDRSNQCKSNQVVACCNSADNGVLLGLNCISVPVCKNKALCKV